MNDFETHLQPNRMAGITVEAFLYDRINYEKTPSGQITEPEFRFQTLQELLKRLGNPHLKYPVIHVAGTKGKGSVCHMLQSILGAAGLRTGLYTSPHLQSVRERFQIGGQWVSEAELELLVAQIRPAVEELDRLAEIDELIHPPTFFELTTAIAFLHFASQDVDLAILEVGMGGRLDSTNICQSQLSVITKISLDHCDQLGDTIPQIAREKAGIIKPGIPVIVGTTQPDAVQTIHQVARDRESPLLQMGKDFRVEVDSASSSEQVARFSWCEPGERIDDLVVGMKGLHQIENAAIAIAAVKQLRHCRWDGDFDLAFEVDASTLRRGLENVSIPGRFETIAWSQVHSAKLVVDIAHNPAAMESVAQTLSLEPDFQKAKSRILVFSTSRGKDLENMLRCVLPLFDRIVLTQFENNPRAVHVEQIQRQLNQILDSSDSIKIEVVTPLTEVAPWLECHADPDDMICVTGSSFLVGEFLDSL